jgi:hypothetical protein
MNKIKGTGELKNKIAILFGLTFILAIYFCRVHVEHFSSPKGYQIELTDERELTSIAKGMAMRNSVNPQWFSHPAATLVLPLAVIYKVFPHDERFSNHVRFFGLFLAGLSLVALFFYLKLEHNVYFALLGTFFLSCNQLFLSLAHMLRNDSNCVLFVSVALIGIYNCRNSMQFRKHLLAGVVIAAAFVTKFNLAFVGLIYMIILTAKLFELSSAERKKMIFCGGVCILGFVVGVVVLHPALLFNYKKVASDFNYQVTISSANRPYLNFGGQILYFLRALFTNLGTPTLLLAGIGVHLSLKKKDYFAISSIIAVIAYFIAIAFPNSYYERWLLPVYPVCLSLALRGLSGVVQNFRYISPASKPQPLLCD